MKKNAVRASLAILALSVAFAAQAQLSAEDMVKFRQSGYTFMSWNMGKIKAQAVDGSVPYNAEQVAAAANAIAAIANSGMGALYGPDTLDATGWKQTRLKANFFDEQEKVREVAVNFIQQANKLQEVAAGGDQQAVAAQFGELGKACKACHDAFRAEE
jgi:cytochrome c556